MVIKKIFEAKGNYTLLQTDASYQPYVVAWHFNGKDWCQGHYFCTLDEAHADFVKRTR